MKKPITNKREWIMKIPQSSNTFQYCVAQTKGGTQIFAGNGGLRICIVRNWDKFGISLEGYQILAWLCCWETFGLIAADGQIFEVKVFTKPWAQLRQSTAQWSQLYKHCQWVPIITSLGRSNAIARALITFSELHSDMMCGADLDCFNRTGNVATCWELIGYGGGYDVTVTKNDDLVGNGEWAGIIEFWDVWRCFEMGCGDAVMEQFRRPMVAIIFLIGRVRHRYWSNRLWTFDHWHLGIQSMHDNEPITAQSQPAKGAEEKLVWHYTRPITFNLQVLHQHKLQKCSLSNWD